MSDFLAKILKARLERVREVEARVPLAEVKRLAAARLAAGDFRVFKPRSRNEVGVIAEIKRASPSKGVIAAEVDVARTARAYDAGGAAAISVLTEPDFFLGSDEDLRTARGASTVPVLRKDFVVTEYQIYESAAIGADLMLLIVRMLEERQLADYVALSRALGMEPLVEIFDASELESLAKSGARLVGINNRDLKTFETDKNRALELARQLPPGMTPVVASAMQTPADMRFYTDRGVNHFLIGESLMRSPDPAAALGTLISEGAAEKKVKICGITTPEGARTVARMAIHAVGFVFYPPSKRYVTPEKARELAEIVRAESRAAGREIVTVGVFVDETVPQMLETTRIAGLDVIQLHGDEPAAAVTELRTAGFSVIRSVRPENLAAADAEYAEILECAPRFQENGRQDSWPGFMFLAESSGGEMPGGEGVPWAWRELGNLAELRTPVLLAGGISPENVRAAREIPGLAGVDVSTGVEDSPGRKSVEKIRRLLAEMEK